VVWLGLGCGGAKEAKPEEAPSAGAPKAPGPALVDAAGSAPVDVAPRPAALIDQVRALPRTPGDRKQATALHRQAMQVHAAKDYDASERLWAEAARTDPSWAWPFYNLACAAAQQARPDAALAYLAMMRDRGPEPELLRRLETDGDLKAIRRLPAFEALYVEIADGIHGRLRDPGCPADMVRVREGGFLMGSPENVGDPDEHPQHEVAMPAYCIDKIEVTVQAYAACVAARACSARAPACRRDVRPAHPVNCVDWDQARAYCKWAGKRLPTETEWEYAARGDDDRTYPWGNREPDGKRVHVAGDRTFPVGSFPEGKSPFGVLDMAGNVLEWTAGAHRSYANGADPPDEDTAEARVVRGGAPGDYRLAHRRVTEAAAQEPLIGFRCAYGE
jgi:formylglycine-generating enzyme required for sulfatase activity